jgi:hypothetical protein
MAIYPIYIACGQDLTLVEATSSSYAGLHSRSLDDVHSPDDLQSLTFEQHLRTSILDLCHRYQ